MKRVGDDINRIAPLLNEPGKRGNRLFPVQGVVVTGIDALRVFAGVDVRFVAAGGRGPERKAPSGLRLREEYGVLTTLNA